jgi:hypothetical protein
MKKLFILREPRNFDAMCAFLAANWPAMAAQGHPLAVRVAPYEDPRSLTKNALMWVWLGLTEHQAWTAGRQYSAAVWNVYFKEKHLPDENAKGMKKWEAMPDGTRRLAMSTSDLNEREMTEYLNTIEPEIVGLGVDLAIDRAAT